MTKPESNRERPRDGDGLLEEGWASLDSDNGGFASEHTTVDPALLDRLAALDLKKASAVPTAKGVKAPEQRERTINLDISDLLAMEEAGSDDEPEVIGEAEIEEVAGVQGAGTPEVPFGAMAGPRAGASSVRATDISNPDQPSVQLDSAMAPEDIDAEFSSERTQIFIPVMEDEPTRAKLRVVQGGGQQKEYLLARDRITIGRGTNNDILVPDIAISRQHFEIVRQADGSFRVADLDSGTGTKLNGGRVLDADLFGGDRIEIGNTVLEFVITGPGASRSPGERRINHHPSEVAAKPVSTSRRTGAVQALPVAAEVSSPPPNYSQPGQNATMTHFQLQSPVAPPPAVPRNTGLIITGLIAVFGLLFLSLAVVIGAKIYLDFQSTQSGKVSNKPASAYFFEGADHVKVRDWDKAEEKFTIAADLAREEREFQIRKDAELQLERVRAEKNNQKAYDRALSLFEKGEHPEALARLAEVRAGSVYDDDARALTLKVRQKHVAELVEQAQVHFDARQFDEADRKIAIALRNQPDHAPALELQGKIDALSESDYKRPSALAEKDPAQSGRAIAPRVGGSEVAVNVKNGDPPKANETGAPPKGNETGDPSKVNPVSERPSDPKGADPIPKKGGSGDIANFGPGLAMYRSKRFAEAIQSFEQIASTSDDDFSRSKASKLAKNVESFEKSLLAGNSAYSSGSWANAATQLEIAYRLDKSISGSGVHGADLGSKLAESNFQLARDAFNGQNFQRAGTHAKKAQAYQSNHPGNLQLLGQLESKGKSMYIDALNKKEKDPTQARRTAKAIVDMLPASSDTHQKAKELLSSL